MLNESEKAVFKLIEDYKTAVYERDIEAFLVLFEGDVCVFDKWDEWSYEGMASWRGAVTRWLGSLGQERNTVEFDHVKVIVEQNMAMVHAFVKFKGLSVEGKELGTSEERLTWTLVQKDGAWKIMHQHTSAPVDFKTKC